MHLAIKRAGVAVLSAGALCVAAAPASAAAPVTVNSGETASWTGAGTGTNLFYYDGITTCDGSPLGMCDSTVVTVAPPAEGEGARTLTVTMSPDYDDNDFDLFVYPDANADGVADGEAIDDGRADTGHLVGEAESVQVANAAGSYLVEIVYFVVIDGSFQATASLSGAAVAAAQDARRGAASEFEAAQQQALNRALTAARR